MKFHKQTLPHIPSLGKIGDCLRTAMACMLDLEPSEVPHFLSIHYHPDGVETKEMRAHISDWLEKRNLAFIDIPYIMEGSPQPLMDHLAERDGEDMCYLLTGKSTSSNHVVICRGRKMLWDPSDSDHGIVAPIDGVYWVSYFVPLFMRYKDDKHPAEGATG